MKLLSRQSPVLNLDWPFAKHQVPAWCDGVEPTAGSRTWLKRPLTQLAPAIVF